MEEKGKERGLAIRDEIILEISTSLISTKLEEISTSSFGFVVEISTK